MEKRVLYLSYDGMTDPLGQSQVIPYLRGLSQLGHSVSIVSAEKKEPFLKKQKEISELLRTADIQWHPVPFSNEIPGLSAWGNYSRLRATSVQLSKQKPFEVIHCRSDIPAIIGLQLKDRFQSKLIFDMRGFWADERVDGGAWNLGNPAYRTAYHFFREKEKGLIRNSDVVVSLTQNGKHEILRQHGQDISEEKIKVIPCCVDLELFSPNHLRLSDQQEWKRKLGIADQDFVLSYSGSLGTWYLLNEMLKFFSLLLLKKPTAKFLFITREADRKIKAAAKDLNIPESNIRVVAAEREQMPLLLSLSSASIFFIKSSYSKKASSPTKMGEGMALGIPVIGNAGVGDVKEIIEQTESGMVLEDFSEEELSRGVNETDRLSGLGREKIRKGAEDFFSLQKGIQQYHLIYSSI